MNTDNIYSTEVTAYVPKNAQDTNYLKIFLESYTPDTYKKEHLEDFLLRYNANQISDFLNEKDEDGDNLIMQYESLSTFIYDIFKLGYLTKELLTCVNQDKQNALMLIIQNRYFYTCEQDEIRQLIKIAGYSGLANRDINGANLFIWCFYEDSRDISDIIIDIIADYSADQRDDILSAVSQEDGKSTVLNYIEYNILRSEDVASTEKLIELASERVLEMQDDNGDNAITLALQSRLSDDNYFNDTNDDKTRNVIVKLISLCNYKTLIDRNKKLDNSLSMSIRCCFENATVKIIERLGFEDVLLSGLLNPQITSSEGYKSYIDDAVQHKIDSKKLHDIVNKPFYDTVVCLCCPHIFSVFERILQENLIDEGNIISSNFTKRANANIIESTIRHGNIKHVYDVIALINKYPHNNEIYKKILDGVNYKNIMSLLRLNPYSLKAKKADIQELMKFFELKASDMLPSLKEGAS